MVAIIILGFVGVAFILWRSYSASTAATLAKGAVPANTQQYLSSSEAGLIAAGCSAGGGPVAGAACNAAMKNKTVNKYANASVNSITKGVASAGSIKLTGDGSFVSGLKYAVEPWKW